jgi:hypothetical protein
MAHSSSGAKRPRSGWRLNCVLYKQNSSAGSTTRQRKWVNGSGRLFRAITNTMLYPANLSQLSALRHRLCRLWRAILSRRSQAQSEALAAVLSVAGTLDSFPTNSTHLPTSSLRLPCIQDAVCVNALVRICAGGDQRWSSLPRQVAAVCPAPEIHFYGNPVSRPTGRRVASSNTGGWFMKKIAVSSFMCWSLE